jgi:hypothetical protein
MTFARELCNEKEQVFQRSNFVAKFLTNAPSMSVRGWIADIPQAGFGPPEN